MYKRHLKQDMKEKLDQKESHNYDVKESNKQKIKIGQVNKTEE